MLVVELNEFNRDLLQSVANRLGLSHLQSILGWQHAETWAENEYDSGFLEPWAQWVSVHTGAPASEHLVKNLGDIPNLKQEQIWESWSKQGTTSVVWGVMNGNRRSAELCRVFIPDPWTFSEDAHPPAYQGLIDLPRYLAKNYLDFSKRVATGKAVRLLLTLFRSARGSDLLDGVRYLARGLRRFGPTNLSFIVFFEYLSVMAFISTIEKLKPDSAIVFINMLAHVQHHYWTAPDGRNCPQIEFAATAVDDMLGKMVARCENLAQGNVAVLNALSQSCTDQEPPWILYRPNNHAKLIETLGINALRVEPLMTYDAHVFFADHKAAVCGMQILQSARIAGKPLFFVEPDEHDGRKLFYRVAMSDPLPPDAEFVYQNQSTKFADHFTAIVQRTGKHEQKGDLFVNFGVCQKRLLNNEVLTLFREKV